MRSLRVKMKSSMRYNPLTGDLIWFMPPRNRPELRGKRVGYVHTRGDGNKIMTTNFDDRKVDNHILVWIWHHGTYPKKAIRHINGDLMDNRIENLEIINEITEQP